MLHDYYAWRKIKRLVIIWFSLQKDRSCNRLIRASSSLAMERLSLTEKDSKRRFQSTFEDTLDEVITRRDIKLLLQTRMLPNDFIPNKTTFNWVRSRHDRKWHFHSVSWSNLDNSRTKGTDALFCGWQLIGILNFGHGAIHSSNKRIG